MEIQLEKELEKKAKLELGDVVAFNTNYYLITKETGSEKYVAKNLNGNSAATSAHLTLEALEQSLDRIGKKYTHYSKNEYVFSLTKKVF